MKLHSAAHWAFAAYVSLAFAATVLALIWLAGLAAAAVLPSLQWSVS